MGGKWNGHIWCVPPNADYKQFIKFLPYEILERINLKNDDSDFVEDDLPSIIFAWNMFKSIASASLKLIKDELNRNYMLADNTYEAVTEFVREIDWKQIERAIESVDVSMFKPIPITNSREKDYPRGILLWGEQVNGEVGFSDIYDETSLYATGEAHEVYLSDELKFICFKIDSKDFFEESKSANTSRKLVNNEEKEDILIEFISSLLGYGQDFTQEFLEKIDS